MSSMGEVSSLLFYCQMSLIKGRKKKKKFDVSIIPQVPVASLVFLPYYEYVLFAGHLSSEIKLDSIHNPKKKKNQLYHLAKTKLIMFNLSIDYKGPTGPSGT